MAIQPRSENDLRGLKALVAILGVLVILGTALVIGIVIHRLYAKPAAPAPGQTSWPAAAPASAMVPGAPQALPLAPSQLAHGEHISGIAGAGGAVAIWVSGPAGDRLLLLNPATGKLTEALSAPP